MSARWSSDDTQGQAQHFATTHWSVVLAAGDTAAPNTTEALERLMRAYWRPLYAFIRRQGRSHEDAQDFTQAFLAWLLESKHLRVADPERGRFRSFLLIRLKRFLSDQRDKANALKRGGGRALVSLDEFATENGRALEVPDTMTPEAIFERRWAETVMAEAERRLKDEYSDDDKAALFELLKDTHPGEPEAPTYAALAGRWGMTEGAIKVAVHRLRRRHRELLREVIAHTVTRPEDMDDEIRHLLTVLGG